MAFYLRGLVLACLAACFAPSGASAQSFNCREAFAPDEILICDRPGLRNLDRELHALYVQKLNAAPVFLQTMIREEQEAWRRSRHRCRNNVRCVRSHYRARLRELEVVLGQGTRPVRRSQIQPDTSDRIQPGTGERIRPETDDRIQPGTGVPAQPDSGGWIRPDSRRQAQRVPAPVQGPTGRAGCTVYRETRFRGENALIEPNVQLAFFSGGWNNRISSLQVSQGCELVAYQNSLFRGRSIKFRQAVRSLNRDWNNKISSLECTCQ